MDSMRYGEDAWRAFARADSALEWVVGDACPVGVVEVMIEHAPQPLGWRLADAQAVARACKVTYANGPGPEDLAWEEVGTHYLDDHYPGLSVDGLVNLRRDDIRLIGMRIGHAEVESERSWWWTCDSEDGCGMLHHFDPAIARSKES